AADLFAKGPSVFNYNFAEVKYIDGDGADGFALVGSGDIKDNIALRVNYISGDNDVDALRLGATYYKQSQRYPRADLNLSAGLDRVEDEGGIFASIGTRYAFNDVIELNAAIELNTVGDTDLDILLAGFYELSPGFSALLETNIGDDTAIALGVRFYWR
ncbi:MAG: hypothetical protein AAF404_17190, partial [Pseudomonadota bacterium]